MAGCIIKASDNRLGGFGKRTEGDETRAMVVVLIILVATIGLALLLYLAIWNRCFMAVGGVLFGRKEIGWTETVIVRQLYAVGRSVFRRCENGNIQSQKNVDLCR